MALTMRHTLIGIGDRALHRLAIVGTGLFTREFCLNQVTQTRQQRLEIVGNVAGP